MLHFLRKTFLDLECSMSVCQLHFNNVKKQHVKFVLGETLLNQNFCFLKNFSSVIAWIWRCELLFVILNFHENSDTSKWKKGDTACYLLHKLYQLSLLSCGFTESVYCIILFTKFIPSLSLLQNSCFLYFRITPVERRKSWCSLKTIYWI